MLFMSQTERPYSL